MQLNITNAIKNANRFEQFSIRSTQEYPNTIWRQKDRGDREMEACGLVQSHSVSLTRWGWTSTSSPAVRSGPERRRRCRCCAHWRSCEPPGRRNTKKDDTKPLDNWFQIQESVPWLTILGHLFTFVAFLRWRALSFWMSCQERIGVFSSSPTTIPGPWVGGPPVNSITRAPVFGNAPCQPRGWGLEEENPITVYPKGLSSGMNEYRWILQWMNNVDRDI